MNWRGRIRRTFPYAIAIIGGFALAYLIVAFFVFPAGVIPTDTKVPNVTGLAFDQAAQMLTQAGFKPEQGEMRFHGSAPKMTVLEQTPRAGSHDLAGATVTLAVSAGQQMGTVPAVVGMARPQAESALESAGFQVGDVAERAAPQMRGEVIETQPAGGSQLPTANSVTLVVSTGPTAVMNPDVVGRNFAEARSMLEQVGLALGEVTSSDGSRPDPAAPVVSQTPAAGSQLARGARVSLRVGGHAP